jgi:hypothetical protein
MRLRAYGWLSLTATAFTALTGLLAWLSSDAMSAVSAPGPATFDALVSLAGAAGAWVCLAWLAGSFALSVLAAAPGVLGRACAAAADRLTPALVRRAAGAALGLAVGAGVAFPTAAAAGAPPAVVAVATSDAAGTSAGRIQPTFPDVPDMDRPAALPAAPQAAAPPTARPQVARAATPVVTGTVRPRLAATDAVVVRRGDTLWDIAARHLGPDASAGEIAQEWPRWHSANRQVIGTDPHHLLPGQQLHPPAAS